MRHHKAEIGMRASVNPTTPTTRKGRPPWRFAERSMEWYGWGSPIGMGAMIVALAAAAVLLRLAIFGL